jgi:hypothetical protein
MGQIVLQHGHVPVIGAEAFQVDGQGSLVKRFGLGVACLEYLHIGQRQEDRGQARVLVPPHFLTEGQGPAGRSLRLGIPRLLMVVARQVVLDGEQLKRLASAGPFEDRLGSPIGRFGLGIAAEIRVGHTEVIPAPRRLDLWESLDAVTHIHEPPEQRQGLHSASLREVELAQVDQAARRFAVFAPQRRFAGREGPSQQLLRGGKLIAASQGAPLAVDGDHQCAAVTLERAFGEFAHLARRLLGLGEPAPAELFGVALRQTQVVVSGIAMCGLQTATDDHPGQGHLDYAVFQTRIHGLALLGLSVVRTPAT